MSSCGDCNCADKNQCVKKGNSYGVVINMETEKIYSVDVAEVGTEHDPKCKCGTNCSCTDCNCGK